MFNPLFNNDPSAFALTPRVRQSNSRIASQFARYKADRFAILLVPGLNPAPAKNFSHHLKVVGYFFALYIGISIAPRRLIHRYLVISLYNLRFQLPGVMISRIGNSSRRPASISMINTIFENGEKKL